MMNSMWAVVTVVVVAMVSDVLGWPGQYDDEYSAWKMARTARRAHSCAGSGVKCFSTSECCKRFVCAAFDDYFGASAREAGMKPEIPGFCVKEKDLQPCYSSPDCTGSARCVSLGRDGENYCVSRQEAEEANEVQAPPRPGPQAAARSGEGNLGSSCQESSQCRAFDNSGHQLCCQSVRRGRQGTKKMCDRVTELSQCL